jgi:hypothetical protein
MSKQWQIRRGTAAENDIFTGAQGEVTMCTDTNELRVHDGVTPGGHIIDAVVDYQLPTADNSYTWYRKYASGWVEQGGFSNTSAQSVNVSLIVEMADSHYTPIITQTYAPAGTDIRARYVQSCTTTMIYTSSASGVGLYWQVSGMAA